MFYGCKEVIPFGSLIYEKFGNVRRARDFYLYTEKKVRLLDMYLNAGRAILGHKPHGVMRRYKKEFDHGICGDLPTRSDSMLKQALGKLFPDYVAALYVSAETALKSASRLILDNGANSTNFDILEEEHRTGKEIHTIDFDSVYIPVYRHFLKENLGYAFLFFPYPSISTTILLIKKYTNVKKTYNEIIFPECEDAILPAEKMAIVSFIHEVLAKQKRDEEGAIKHSMRSKKNCKKEKQTQKEKDVMLPFLSKFFHIQGCYLYFKKDCRIDYKDFFEVALEKHKILLSPCEDAPSIFPILQNYDPLIDFFSSL